MKSKFKFSLIILSFTLLLLSLINVTALNENTVILGGEPFGIKMFSKGVMVIKSENPEINEKDIILYADDQYVSSSKKLKEIIINSEGNQIKLNLIRNDNKEEILLTPIIDHNGEYKLGLWVKDSAAGLGTLTFYDNKEKYFCGLGHGICESDTGQIIPIKEGVVEKAYITSVTKNKNGIIGSLNGYFLGEDIGSAHTNIREGVYGTLNKNICFEEIQIADSSEIKLGDAFIYTTIKGDTPSMYKAKILEINRKDETQNLIIEITDQELLNLTGGIVQGMSGSPIIQNGKIIGAVTHVIINSPSKGYGIFAETMQEKGEYYSNYTKTAS